MDIVLLFFLSRVLFCVRVLSCFSFEIFRRFHRSGNHLLHEVLEVVFLFGGPVGVLELNSIPDYQGFQFKYQLGDYGLVCISRRMGYTIRTKLSGHVSKKL